jgi:hypothetical protein
MGGGDASGETRMLSPPVRASSSMAEQRTLNPQVQGSNPWGRTTKALRTAVRRPASRSVRQAIQCLSNRLALGRVEPEPVKGHLRQRSPGVWEGIVIAGRDPLTGRWRYRSRTVRGTKREAQRRLASLVHEVSSAPFGRRK